MKKRILLYLLIMIVFLGVVGCSNKEEATLRQTAKNKLTCSDEQTKYVFSFDENDMIKDFDLYQTIDNETNMTETEMEQKVQKVCNGDGEFPKDWIGECELLKDKNSYTLHIYIKNNKWFGDILEKEKIKKIAEEDGIESYPLECK